MKETNYFLFYYLLFPTLQALINIVNVTLLGITVQCSQRSNKNIAAAFIIISE